eukprot:GO255931.1.p1 GENE.GO255931.1~~GO255931.1.p1  ORF type:complete len:127 (+),score=1.85 GO255931.1:122-502(+)
MFSIAVTSAAGLTALPVAAKAVGELHRQVFLQSNTLARQGMNVPDKKGEGEKLARQRSAGINGGLSGAKKDPAYLRDVPSRPMAGDKRRDYEVGSLGNATSSRGNITDILDKVPRRTLGGTQTIER